MRRLLTAAILLAGLAPRPLGAQKVIIAEKLEDLEARVRTDSNDAAAHYNVAIGYWSRKRWGDAERELRDAIAIENTFAEAYLALGVVRERDQDYWSRIWRAGKDAAVRDTVKARDRLITHAFLLDPLVDIRMLGGVRTSSASGGILGGLNRLLEGQYAPAFEAFDQEVERAGRKFGMDSVGTGLLFLRAMAAEHSGHDSVAVEDLTRLIARMEKVAAGDTVDVAPLEANEYRYTLAALHQRAGRTDEAIRGYQTVLENDVGNYMAHVQLARIYEAAHDWPRALAERRRALDVNPGDPSLLLDLGVTLGRAGQFPAAADTLEKAVEANPRDTRPLYWLGIADLQLQKRDAARAAFARFVSLAPSRYDRQIASARQRLTELH